MKKNIIGIPRAYNNYQFEIMLKTFFEHIGCKAIISPETNNEILELSPDYNHSFLQKIYLGHITYLVDKCDYVLIPRIYNQHIAKKEIQFINDIYNEIREIIPKQNLLIYPLKNKYKFLTFFKMGLIFTKNPLKIFNSYLIAKQKQKIYLKTYQNEENNKLVKDTRKIIIMSQFNNLEDKYIMGYILKYLKSKKIIPIYSNKIINLFDYHSKKDPIKEVLDIIYYYQEQLDGIIYINIEGSPIKPNIKKQLQEMNVKIPFLNLKISNNCNEIYIETILESYLEMICKLPI